MHTHTHYLSIDVDLFCKEFPNKAFMVEHQLATHPLFELASLIDLARRLPAACIEYNSGRLEINQDPAATPRNGLSIEETIAGIENNASWMVLKNVERDPDYAQLLETCLAEIGRYSEWLAPGMMLPEGFIFISSPHAVTPFHMDPEHNFLAQIAGEKIVHAFDAYDRELVSEEQLEQFYAPNVHRNLPYRSEFASKARQFTLRPGNAMYFPQNSPHWVQNGDAVSISFSITFRSALSERRSRLYYLNGRLRAAGLRPHPVGVSPLRDTLKDFAFRSARKAASVLRVRPQRRMEAQY